MTRNNKNELSGSDLKIIAMISMLIDHIAASVIERYMSSVGIEFNVMNPNGSVNAIYLIYFAMRLIGRLAFPIYIFLLVEGFLHTRSRVKYLVRLLIFALVSEIPFDIAFQLEPGAVKNGRLFEFTYQNVFFTLAIGMLTIMVIEWMRQYVVETIPRFLFTCLITVLGMAAAFILKTDYDMSGVWAIVAAYVARTKLDEHNSTPSVDVESEATESKHQSEVLPAYEHRKMLNAMCECAVVLTIFNLIEAVSFLDVLFIKRYNGKRGVNVKLLFYAFYPVHLLVLGFVCVFFNI
jgi:hypothetical protein